MLIRNFELSSYIKQPVIRKTVSRINMAALGFCAIDVCTDVCADVCVIETASTGSREKWEIQGWDYHILKTAPELDTFKCT